MSHHRPHRARRDGSALLLALSAGCALTAAPALAQCPGTWSDQFALAGTNAQISDTVVWDDGTGPALYAVGLFNNREIGRVYQIINSSSPGNVTVSGAYHVAKWDGRNWNIVGQNPIFQSDAPFAAQRLNTIQVFDPDGPGPLPEGLVVGGVPNGSSPGPHSTLYLGGGSWIRLGQNICQASGEEIRDLEVFNGELYACGKLSPESGLSGIAKWDVDTQQWVDVAGGIPTPTNFVRVERMAVGDADGDGTAEMYVSGTFTFSATGGSAVKLVKWNGSNWSTVPGFTGTSTTNAANLGGPTLLKFMDIGDGPGLLVGDAIYSGLAAPANTRGVALARLKNGVWGTLLPQTGTASGTIKSYVYSADMFAGPQGSQLHIGGTRLLNGVSGQPTGVSLARRSAAGTWSPLGTFPPNPATNTGTIAWMRPLDWDGAGPGGQKLLVGATQFRWGTIGALSGLEPLGMALWNGSAVEIAHSGSNSLGLGVTMFKELDPDGAGPQPTTFYIGSASSVVDGVPTSGLVAFDGSDYQRTPAGITQVVAAEAFTPAGGPTQLYAAGELINANGPALVRLDGSAWTTVAQPSFDESETQAQGIDALTTLTVAGEPSLIVSGRLRELGGVPSRFVTRFNGTTWVAMDAGLPTPGTDPNLLFRINSSSYRVVKFNGELYMTVQPSVYNLTTFSESFLPARLYRWDGSAWQDIGPGEGRLEVLDLGSGPKMYTLRNFQPTGSDNSYVAEWNGTTFVQVGPGFNWSNPLASRSNIQGVTAHDFGQGKRLVVTLDGPGTSNGLPVSGMLYLEGGQWRQVPGAELLSQTPRLFSSSNPAWGGLYVGGAIRAINNNAFNQNGVESQGIARYINGACSCGPSDIAGPGQVVGADGELTADDIIVFIGWFFAADARADVAGAGQTVGADGQFTADDIILFINRFFAGC
jgi:hypothetical protein